MIDTALSKKLISYFQKLIAFYKDFLKLESEKYADLKSGNLKMLDGHMKKEQAFVMKAKGFEIERQNLMDQTGKPKATFKEIIPAFAPEKQKEVNSLYSELSKVLLELKKMNSQCSKLTKMKLRRIAVIRSKLKNNPELKRTYDQSLRRGPDSPRFLSKKI